MSGSSGGSGSVRGARLLGRAPPFTVADGQLDVEPTSDAQREGGGLRERVRRFCIFLSR
jgi:hypothetical protein